MLPNWFMCGMSKRTRTTVTKMSRISGKMTLRPIWPLLKVDTNSGNSIFQVKDIHFAFET